MKVSRDSYFNNKKGGDPKKRSGSRQEHGEKKKLRLQVAALQRQVDEAS